MIECVSFVVPSGVPAIGQAQVVQRPSSPHASEIEPSVDEVTNLSPRGWGFLYHRVLYSLACKDCMYVLHAVSTS